MDYIHRDESAVYYECGFSCDNALFLRLGSEAFFITDARYTTEAKERVRGAEVMEARDLFKAARELLKKSGAARLVYDPKEFSARDIEQLRRLRTLSLIPKPDLSHDKRIIKRPDEIAKIERAVELGAQSFNEVARMLSESAGKSEKRLAFEAEAILRRYGELELSFTPILAFDENAAKPHATPTDKPLQEGTLVLFDAGVKYERYCSDRTRTAHFDGAITFGKEQRFKNAKVQRAYDLVKKAQEAAIEAARPGMRAKELDAVARKIIDESEFAGTFVHSLGHGVGLDIHEKPYINSKNEQVLKEGMVFTIEPGIYIPGEFGIRIEDMVVLESAGARVL
jgi:Xaa-Pro aminopeptidase